MSIDIPWVDSDTFEPNKYFSRLLKEKTLSGLIKRDNELVAGKENGCMTREQVALMALLLQRFARLTVI